MARPRQKKKQRSSRSTVKTGQAGRTKAGKKKVNFLGNEIIAKNWDHKLTLAQNYERLGLSVRLNNRTGGVEKHRAAANVHEDEDDEERTGSTRRGLRDSLHISRSGIGQLVPTEVEVERDPETGAILRIVGEDEDNTANRDPYGRKGLNDPLALLEDDGDDIMEIESSKRNQNKNEIVRQLEAQAVAESEEIALKKRPRQQSEREEEWIRALVEKYDDDYAAMFRDRKLNPRQQSEGDIRKRVKKWKNTHR